MSIFNNLPAELREHIVAYLLPDRIDLGQPFPPTLLSLLLTSKQSKDDVIAALELLDTTITIPDPTHFPKLARLTTLVRVTALRLQIYYQSSIVNPKHKDHLLYVGDDGLLAVWLLKVPSLSIPPSVRTIILDLTPAPHWLLATRPEWVAGHVNDKRVAKLFLRNYVIPDAITLLRLLRDAAPPTVELHVGGYFAERSRRLLDDLVAQTQTILSATFLGHPRNVSVSEKDYGLWLFQTAQSLGVQQQGEEVATRPGHSANLGCVRWEYTVQGLYHINAMEDEGRTRREFVRLLGLAGRQACGEREGEVWFEPTEPARRKLIHHLCRSLGLCSTSESSASVSTSTKRVRAYISTEVVGADY